MTDDLVTEIELVRDDEEFMAAAERLLARDSEILDRLAD